MSRSAPASSTTSGRWPRSMLAIRDVILPIWERPWGFWTKRPALTTRDGHPTVQAATDDLWVKHRKGLPLAVQPGSVVSPQAGKEVRGNGQEVFHAIMMNARLLMHNPDTGEPGAINGHAGIQFYVAPDNERAWNMEVPYVSDAQIGIELTKYGMGVRREIQKDPDSSSDESVASDGWRATPIVAPVPIRSATARYFCILLTKDLPVRVQLPYMTNRVHLTNTWQKTLKEPKWIAHPSIRTTMDHQTRRNESCISTAEAELDAIADSWKPAPDAWTAQNPTPLERWDFSGDRIERIQYKRGLAIGENRMTSSNSQTNAHSSEIVLADPDESSDSGSSLPTSSEEEEGEIMEEAASPPGIAPHLIAHGSVAHTDRTLVATRGPCYAQVFFESLHRTHGRYPQHPPLRPTTERKRVFIDVSTHCEAQHIISAASGSVTDQDPHYRATAHTRLLNWGCQQEALLERLRDEENDMFLEPLMDRAATIMLNGRAKVFPGSGFLDAEQTLDLVAQQVGPGKRKVRDESL
ncbi:hypothetical protein B0H13DRAFT_1871680 [Mycena leptocephala]|nr:hypothetical protein B0H13DRAFT_1871680 [Mycena leptocephala]